MSPRDIPHHRLASQHIATSKLATPLDVVTSLGAMQAQDFAGVLWSIGLRLLEPSEAAVKQAISDRQILRTWPIRGTLHLIPAVDAHWMTRLLTPRIIRGSASRCRQLGLDEACFKKSRNLFSKALQGGRQLTREAMYQLLEDAGLSPQGQRGIHIICRLAMEGLLCFGEHEGKQPSFALLDEWVPNPRRLSREEGLATLAARYFTTHGPATIHDFAWWSGLTLTDSKEAISSISSQLIKDATEDQSFWMAPSLPQSEIDQSTVHLLPGFDEFMLGYTDRSHALAASDAPKIVPGNNGMFMPTIVSKGQVIGTWKRTLKKKTVVFEPVFFRSVTKSVIKAATTSAAAYAKYLGLDLSIGSDGGLPTK